MRSDQGARRRLRQGLLLLAVLVAHVLILGLIARLGDVGAGGATRCTGSDDPGPEGQRASPAKAPCGCAAGRRGAGPASCGRAAAGLTRVHDAAASRAASAANRPPRPILRRTPAPRRWRPWRPAQARVATWCNGCRTDCNAIRECARPCSASPVAERSVANAVQLWNGRWIEDPGGADRLAAVRAATVQAILAAPPGCRQAGVAGPRLILFDDGPETVVLSLGSGTWRWTDLVVTATMMDKH